MKSAGKALILIFIFAAGLVGRTWIFSQTHVSLKLPTNHFYFQKNTSSRSTAGDLETILTKIIKKRRKETLNFAKVFSKSSFAIAYHGDVSIFDPTPGLRLFSADSPPLFQPPI